MKINLIYNCILLTSLLLTSCGNEVSFDREAGEKPNPITNIKHEALSGKAKIFINTPQVDDYIYTKIEYTIKKGVTKSVKISKYDSSIILDGFSDAGIHKIKVTPVSKGEVEGETNEFSIEVLEPPYKVVKNTIKLSPTFAGIFLNYENPEEDKLSINLATYHADEKKIKTDAIKQIFNKADKLSFLGLPSVENDYYIYVSDRWGNVSDTIKYTTIPFQEREIDKSLFREWPIKNQGSVLQYNSNFALTKIWNNLKGISDGPRGFWSLREVLNINNGKTFSFAIDFNKPTVLSRFLIYHHIDFPFSNITVKTFALYGSNNPNNEESLESWEYIQDFTSTKPAGMTSAQITDYATINGEEYLFNNTPASYRYYRFVIKSVWALLSEVEINEMSFFGIYTR